MLPPPPPLAPLPDADALALALSLSLAQRDTPRSTSSHTSTAGRRREDEASSAASSKRSRRARSGPSSTGSGAFSSSTKQRLDALYGRGQCWFCPSRLVQHAHVIGALDHKNCADLKRLALLNLDGPTAFENGVLLCPNCHKAYDDAYRPKLVIVPADLGFFAAVEQAWQQQPTLAVRAPTAASYHAHCAKAYPSSLWASHHVRGGQTASPWDDAPSQGGLYLGCMDENFLGFEYAQSRDHRPWHGDPMAMVHHAIFAAHRIAAPDLLPKDVWDQLRQLSVLYQHGDDLMRSLLAGGSAHPPPPPPPSAVLSAANPPPGPSSNADSRYPGLSIPPNPPAPPPPPPPPPSSRPHNAAKRGLADDTNDAAAPRKRARYLSRQSPPYAVRRFLSAGDDSRSAHARRASCTTANFPPRSRPAKRARSDDFDSSRKRQRYATPPPSRTLSELALSPNQAQAQAQVQLQPPGSAPEPEPEPKTWRWGPHLTAQAISESWRILYPSLWARDRHGQWRYIGDELGHGDGMGPGSGGTLQTPKHVL